MPPTNEKLDELIRLARDNNKMLHAMRRNAFFGSVLKVIIYAALILGPLWFYQQYLSASVEQMQKALSQMQGTGTQAQVQLQSLQDALKKMQAFMPSVPKQ